MTYNTTWPQYERTRTPAVANDSGLNKVISSFNVITVLLVVHCKPFNFKNILRLVGQKNCSSLICIRYSTVSLRATSSEFRADVRKLWIIGLSSNENIPWYVQLLFTIYHHSVWQTGGRTDGTVALTLCAHSRNECWRAIKTVNGTSAWVWVLGK